MLFCNQERIYCSISVVGYQFLLGNLNFLDGDFYRIERILKIPTPLFAKTEFWWQNVPKNHKMEPLRSRKRLFSKLFLSEIISIFSLDPNFHQILFSRELRTIKVLKDFFKLPLPNFLIIFNLSKNIPQTKIFKYQKSLKSFYKPLSITKKKYF